MIKIIVIMLVMIATPTLAMVKDKDLCLYYAEKLEYQKGIKENILSTIALVETGRFTHKNPLGSPWPWTIAYQDKGHYFATKQEAVNKVKELQKKGIKSIDIGCMQINWFYHGKAFKSIEDAFSPESNIAYAADFLKRLYNKHKSWGAAATAYHSHTPEKAYKYEEKLIKTWIKLKKHLAAGGRLYDPPQIKGLTPLADAEKKQIPKIVEIPKITRTKMATSDKNAVSQADFASQWRVRKLTEYRLRKSNSITTSTSNKVNETNHE